MLMPIIRNIYAVGCPREHFSLMKETSETACGMQDAKWYTSDTPSEEMRGFCIILYGNTFVPAVTEST